MKLDAETAAFLVARVTAASPEIIHEQLGSRWIDEEAFKQVVRSHAGDAENLVHVTEKLRTLQHPSPGSPRIGKPQSFKRQPDSRDVSFWGLVSFLPAVEVRWERMRVALATAGHGGSSLVLTGSHPIRLPLHLAHRYERTVPAALSLPPTQPSWVRHAVQLQLTDEASHPVYLRVCTEKAMEMERIVHRLEDAAAHRAGGISPTPLPLTASSLGAVSVLQRGTEDDGLHHPLRYHMVWMRLPGSSSYQAYQWAFHAGSVLFHGLSSLAGVRAAREYQRDGVLLEGRLSEWYVWPVGEVVERVTSSSLKVPLTGVCTGGRSGGLPGYGYHFAIESNNGCTYHCLSLSSAERSRVMWELRRCAVRRQMSMTPLPREQSCFSLLKTATPGDELVDEGQVVRQRLRC